jgi:hypothetical protein
MSARAASRCWGFADSVPCLCTFTALACSDDSFGNDDALVACRQLGFTGGSVVYQGLNSTYLITGGTGSILLDDLTCDPTVHRTIELCPNAGGWGVHNCGHNEDVGVYCSRGAPALPRSPPAVQATAPPPPPSSPPPPPPSSPPPPSPRPPSPRPLPPSPPSPPPPAPYTVSLGAYAASVLPYVLRGRQGAPAPVNASSPLGYVWANSLRSELVPVCYPGWSNETAALVCRAAGFPGGRAAALSLNLRQRLGPVLSQVDCGGAASWQDCTALLTPSGRCLRLASAECTYGGSGPPGGERAGVLWAREVRPGLRSTELIRSLPQTPQTPLARWRRLLRSLTRSLGARSATTARAGWSPGRTPPPEACRAVPRRST